MRPIKVDDSLRDFAKTFSEELFKDKQPNFIKPQDGLKTLLNELSDNNEKRILKFIIKQYENGKLLCYSVQELQSIVDKVDDNYLSFFYKKHQDKNGKMEKREKATDFSKKIVKALRYDELQNSEVHKILDKLKIKACPYCNSMLTININDGKETKPRFQIDHFFPKSKYPFLCTSFFNLIPSCGHCNQSKSDRDMDIETHFHLYAEETPENAFRFKLDDASVIKKTLKIKEQNIKIQLTHTEQHDSVKNKEYADFVKKHDEIFNLTGIYETQNDVAEELIWRKQAYSKTNIAVLGNLLNLEDGQINRMVFGFYPEYENIHLRPLTKFMQDISSDLDEIDDDFDKNCN